MFWIVIVAALSGLLFGYNTCIISTAQLFIGKQFALTPFIEGILVSSILFGALVGALGGGVCADRFGRRLTILATAVVYAVSSIMLFYAPDINWLITARFIGGLALGVSSFVTPLYIAELAPKDKRGALVTANQLMVTIGILAAYYIGYLFAFHKDWRSMFGVAFIPAILQAIGMLFLPESPRWLISRGLTEKAKVVLKQLGQKISLKEIEESDKNLKKKSRSRWSDLTKKNLLRPLVIGVGLSFFQQVTGINTVIYYAPQIFELSGFVKVEHAILASLAVGSINVLATILSLWLLDRLGRKKLLIIGVTGMAVSLCVLALAFFVKGIFLTHFSVVVLMAYVAFFAIGLGPVAWLMIAEIYPLKVRGKAMSLATGVNWGANILVSLSFLSLLNFLGTSWTFFVYALISAWALWFILKKVPETKGKTLEEIELMWSKRGKNASID